MFHAFCYNSQMKNNYSFEICARAVVIQNKRLLVCKNKAKNYYFFPGGHIEFNETAKEALKRELKEELGMKAKKFLYLGTIENIYTEDKIRHHEINLVFKTDISKLSSLSREDHIAFDFVDIRKLKREKIYPLVLRNALVKYLKNKKTFWASRNEK